MWRQVGATRRGVALAYDQRCMDANVAILEKVVGPQAVAFELLSSINVSSSCCFSLIISVVLTLFLCTLILCQSLFISMNVLVSCLGEGRWQ